jgi:hypothetical protein
MESEWTILWFAGIVILGFAFFFVVFNNSGDKIFNDTVIINPGNNTSQSINVLYWDHMPLTYTISSCEWYQKSRIITGLQYLQNETLGAVSFLENDSKQDIIFICLNESSPSQGYYRGGQAKIRALDNKIFYAEVILYNETRDSLSCGTFMDTEIHEILHALGYSHSDNPLSIMSPISGGQCDVRDVEPEIIQELMLKYRK